MSGFYPCCNPVGSDPPPVDVTHTIINIGGEVEWYVIGTGPNPFELRTAVSSDGSVAITQGASTNDFVVDFAGNVSIINVGGFSEWFRIGTNNPFELRTAQSSDGSVAITQNLNDLDFVVQFPTPPPEAWQEDTTAVLLTNSNTFVTLVTIPGDAKVLDGEQWKINMCVLVCEPYATAGLMVNAETLWLIETSAGVFTEFDRYSTDGHILIVGLEKSSPRHRTKKLTAGMDAPRMRVDVRRSTAGSSSFLWEDARCGGVRIAPAP